MKRNPEENLHQQTDVAFVTAGDEKLVVDFQDNVFESSYGNAMLPCNYRVRYAARRQYGDVVFTQCEHE